MIFETFFSIVLESFISKGIDSFSEDRNYKQNSSMNDFLKNINKQKREDLELQKTEQDIWERDIKLRKKEKDLKKEQPDHKDKVFKKNELYTTLSISQKNIISGKKVDITKKNLKYFLYFLIEDCNVCDSYLMFKLISKNAHRDFDYKIIIRHRVNNIILINVKEGDYYTRDGITYTFNLSSGEIESDNDILFGTSSTLLFKVFNIIFDIFTLNKLDYFKYSKIGFVNPDTKKIILKYTPSEDGVTYNQKLAIEELCRLQ